MDMYSIHRSPTAGWALSIGLALSAPIALAEQAAIGATALSYESVFDKYEPYKEQKVLSWRETNDVVEKIGGWAVYAREARLPEPSSDTMTKDGAAMTGSDATTEQGKKP